MPCPFKNFLTFAVFVILTTPFLNLPVRSADSNDPPEDIFPALGKVEASESFPAEAPYALVIVGLQVADLPDYGRAGKPRHLRIVWQAFNPETKTLVHYGNGDADRFEVALREGPFFRKKNTRKMSYHIYKVYPGDYVLAWVKREPDKSAYHDWFYTASLSAGTVGFHADPGKVYFLGEYTLVPNVDDNYRYDFKGHDISGVGGFLRDYPKIPADFEVVDPYPTTFVCPEEFYDLWSYCDEEAEWIVIT